MDAAYITLKKTALLLAFALLCLGSWSSTANAQSLSTCGTVALTSQTFQAQCNVSSSGAAVTFSGSITYSDSTQGWLSVNSLSSQSTPATLVVGLGSTAILNANPGSHSATITLTPSAPSGATGATISVTFTPGAGSGGGGGITASSLQTFCPTSACPNPQNLTLSTTSNTAINFSISTPPSWLYVSSLSGSVSNGSPATLTVYVENFTIASSTSLTISYSNTSTSVPITVSGSGTGGTISAFPSSITLNYTTNGVVPSSSVSFTDSSGSAYWYASATVTTSNDPQWLDVNSSGNTSTGGYIAFSGNSASLNVVVNSSVIGSLTTGTHSGTVTINDISNNSTTIPVTLTVNGSGGTGNGTITVNPSSITLPSSAIGSTTTVQAFATVITNTTGILYGQSSSGTCNGISLSLPNSNNVTAGSAVTLTVYGSPNGISGTGFTDNCNEILTLYNTSNTFVGSVTVPITWIVGSGSGTGNGVLTVSPSSITLPSVAIGATATVQTSATVSSNTTGTLTSGISGTCLGITPILSSTSLTAGGAAVGLTVYGNPNGYSASAFTDTCTLTLNLYNSSSSLVGTATVPITWTIGTGSGTGGGSSSPVLPTSLSFASQNGSTNSLTAQLVTINAVGNWTASTSYNSTQTGWISVATSGTSSGGSTTPVSITPSNLGAGTYTGTVTFSTNNGSQAVTVTLLVSSSTPVIYASPFASFNLQTNGGTIIGNVPSFQVLTSDGSRSPIGISTSQSWLVLSTPATGNTGDTVSAGINPTSLANGVYYATINITDTAAANTPLAVPVVLTVTGSTATGGGSLSFSTSSLTFNVQANGSAPAAQGITVTNQSGVSYYASASGTSNGITWLSVQPSNQYSSSYSQTVTVAVNQAGLPTGSYTGYVYFYSTSGGNQQVPVTLNVTTTGTTAALSASPTSFAFSVSQNGTAPAAQATTVTSTTGASVGFNVSTSVQSGAFNWLSATTSSNATPATVTVSVQTALSPGTYSGTVVLTPTNGAAILDIPVTLVVTGLPTVSASPTTLSLTYIAGGASPTGTIGVNGGAGLNYLATATSTCNCIAISPTSGNTSSNPAITVSLTNTGNLAAGSYTGTITVSGTNGSAGSTAVTVTLTVTAPLPTISAVVNAASGVSGVVSPGEIVSIFAPATNPIGPATGVGLTSANLVNGNVPTTGLGGVSVTFNGRPAAVLYASATQVNAVVPYGVAGFNNFPVIVSYLGQTSNGFSVSSAAIVPGIFTQNNAGTGLADVLNSDGRTVNGPTTPAAKGSIVSVYMTGEGATTPKGVDGLVTCSAGCSSISQIPIPLLPVAVLVDGQPATVSFYGEAPLLVSGVMQVNFVVPAAARSGTVSLVVSVGGSNSQQGVTMAVQ